MLLLMRVKKRRGLSCCAAVDDGDEGVVQVAEVLGEQALAVAAHQVAHLDGATER